MADQAKPRRRFIRFGLLTLMAITLLCVLLAVRVSRAHKLHNVADAIANVYGEVAYRDDASFLASCLGVVLGKGVADIREVNVPVGRDSVVLLDTFKSIPNLKRLSHTTWRQADIDRLRTELPKVEFGESRVGGPWTTIEFAPKVILTAK